MEKKAHEKRLLFIEKQRAGPKEKSVTVVCIQKKHKGISSWNKSRKTGKKATVDAKYTRKKPSEKPGEGTKGTR